MTHFVALCIVPAGQNLDTWMAPFSEELRVARYVSKTRPQIIRDERERFEEYRDTLYADYLADKFAYRARNKNNPAHLRYLEDEFPKRFEWDDEEFYQEGIRWEEAYDEGLFHESEYEESMLDPEGSITTTYNPNTLWDWYVVGGRWDGCFADGNNIIDAADLAYWLRNTEEEGYLPRALVDHENNLIRKGKEGWFGFTEDTIDDATWRAKTLDALDSADAGATAYFIDCHI
jgi:hypothetical protein